MAKCKYFHSPIIANNIYVTLNDFNNLQNLCFIVIDGIHALKVYPSV